MCCVKKQLFHFQHDTFILIKYSFINSSCTFSVPFVIWRTFIVSLSLWWFACRISLCWEAPVTPFPRAGATHILCMGSHSHVPQHRCSLRGQSSASYQPLDTPCRAKHVHVCCRSFPYHTARELFQPSKPFLSSKSPLSFYCFCRICGTERWELNTALQVRAYVWFI